MSQHFLLTAAARILRLSDEEAHAKFVEISPHPGLSDDDDSTFRLHVVLLTARLVLARFDIWGKA